MAPVKFDKRSIEELNPSINLDDRKLTLRVIVRARVKVTVRVTVKMTEEELCQSDCESDCEGTTFKVVKK